MNIKYLENSGIYKEVILDATLNARYSIWIATANVKDLQIEEGREYVSILKIFRDLCRKNIDIRILHSGIPSEAFLEDFKKYSLSKEKNFQMKRCPRVHLKAILIDKSELFVGSPNLTGAGMGAKSENRRNFEIGFITDSSVFIKNLQSLFTRIWDSEMCKKCGRKDICYSPLEGPV